MITPSQAGAMVVAPRASSIPAGGATPSGHQI
jgi:hypothetical protein